MKARWVILAGAVFGLAVLAQAQQPARRGKRHQREAAAATSAVTAQPCQRDLRGAGAGPVWEQLGLTDDQKAQLAKLREANGGQARQAMQDIRSKVQGGELTPEQARAEMDNLRAQHRQELAGILTPEQLQKLDELRAAAGPGRWNGQAGAGQSMGRSAGMGVGPVCEQLGLTEEQKAQLAALREQNREQMQQAVQSIRAQVRSGAWTREQARAEMDKLREQRRQDLAGILTPEQFQKLDALRANRPPRGTAPTEQESAPASKSAGVQQESWGSIKYQNR